MIFSASRKLRAVEREITWRREVYPRLIRQGKMTADRAKEEIDVMRAIADDYREAAAKEQLPL